MHLKAPMIEGLHYFYPYITYGGGEGRKATTVFLLFSSNILHHSTHTSLVKTIPTSSLLLYIKRISAYLFLFHVVHGSAEKI